MLLRLDDALNTPPYNLAESITRLKMVSVLCVPIKAGDLILGCVYLENRKLSGVFTAETEQLVAGFADRIGTAVLNAEILAGLRRDYEQLRRDFAKECGFDGVVGHNPDFLEVLRVIGVAAKSDIPMPAAPIISKGLRPILSTVQIAIMVNIRLTAPTATCCNNAASIFSPPRSLNISLPKYRNTLIPVTCCSIASTTPIAHTTRIPGWNNCFSDPLSCETVVSISASSRFA